jgi:hypothetical protein
MDKETTNNNMTTTNNNMTTNTTLDQTNSTGPMADTNVRGQISAKVAFLKPNGKNWDITVTKNLRDYAYQAYSLMWMTGEDAKQTAALSQKLSFASTTLSFFTTIAIAGLLPIVDKFSVLWLTYLLVCLGIVLSVCVAVINGYKSVYQLDQTIQVQTEKSSKYGKLFRSIKDQFYLQKENRYDAKTLTEFVSDRYDELNRESLLISYDAEKKWLSQVPRDESGNIDYDQILMLPSELRQDEDKDLPYVTVDLSENMYRMSKSLGGNKKTNKN